MNLSKRVFIQRYCVGFSKPLLSKLFISAIGFMMLGTFGEIKKIPVARCYMERKPATVTSSELVKDIDGNIYHSVAIGRQVWMLENLRTTHYNDSTEIPDVKKQAVWNDLQTGACCSYPTGSKNDRSYGKLYNWYAVNKGTLCPRGWHVPTHDDWKILVDFLGGDSVAGTALQVFNPKHTLISAETGLPLKFNSSGFQALPAGKRQAGFVGKGEEAWFWTSTEFCWKSGGCYMGYYVTMNFPGFKVELNEVGAKSSGFSVRCIKD